MIDSSAKAVATDPRWLPHTYGPDGSELTCVYVPRENHAQLMFLSDEHYAGQYRKATHRMEEILALSGEAESAPLHFIFHTAFCCSTLMVKALDIRGLTLGLKEPDILINLANRLVRDDGPANRQRLDLALRLLSRPFAPGETVIVKPSNFANRVLVPTLDTLPQARAVLLYSDLPTLLRSLVKRGIWGRIWARKLFRSAGAWTSLNFGYDPGETFELTDLQVAGLAWLMQVHHFSEAARAAPGRVMIIDSADFIADTARTLAQVAEFFGLDLSADAVDEITRGPVFSRHSKLQQRDYSIEAREAEHDATVAAHGEEIDVVVKWTEAVAVHCGVALKPAAA